MKFIDDKELEEDVPIENEEFKPKNNSQSYKSKFIPSEIKLTCAKILLSKSHNW